MALLGKREIFLLKGDAMPNTSTLDLTNSPTSRHILSTLRLIARDGRFVSYLDLAKAVDSPIETVRVCCGYLLRAGKLVRKTEGRRVLVALPTYTDGCITVVLNQTLGSDCQIADFGDLEAI
jgi:hypothetical protein